MLEVAGKAVYGIKHIVDEWFRTWIEFHGLQGTTQHALLVEYSVLGILYLYKSVGIQEYHGSWQHQNLLCFVFIVGLFADGYVLLYRKVVQFVAYQQWSIVAGITEEECSAANVEDTNKQSHSQSFLAFLGNSIVDGFNNKVGLLLESYCCTELGFNYGGQQRCFYTIYLCFAYAEEQLAIAHGIV